MKSLHTTRPGAGASVAALALAAALLAGLATGPVPFVTPAAAQTADAPSRTAVIDVMKRATQFMTDKVAVNGGYVWSYLPDFSRRWGEMEAKPTMMWIQPPGTPTMGHLYLDAYHATADEDFYRAAEQVANALIWGQHPTGGWNYIVDFAGEGSLRDWYATIGANGWRLEEFLHYYGNATFDDAGTSEAAQFLLRLYVEKRDPKFRPALDKAIQFVLDSQYPFGGWPQRYPLSKEFSHHGLPDYTSYPTLNDDVAGENIKFLVMCYQALGEQRALEAVTRAMNAFLVLQQGQPQPGFALQYTPDLKPAGARTYEPRALATHTTAAALGNLMTFYELTGDTRYLARIPEALDWLESVKLDDELAKKTGRTHPTFIEIGTNRPLYIHRRGSNIVSGAYYVDYVPDNTVGHYSSFRAIDVAGLRARYEALKATSPESLRDVSPLTTTDHVPLPAYFTLAEISVSDLNSAGQIGSAGKAPSAEDVARIMSDLNQEGYWPSLLRATSNPYAGPGPETPTPGDYATTRVGDRYDTSPYITDEPVTGISIATYIQNMGTMIDYLSTAR